MMNKESGGCGDRGAPILRDMTASAAVMTRHYSIIIL